MYVLSYCRPPPAAVYCRNFEEIQEGRLIEVDVCLSITLGEELPRRAAPCVDLTGAELHLCFSTAAEGMSLRGALLESAGRRHGGVRGGVRAWLVARKLLVRWWEHGKIRYHVVVHLIPVCLQCCSVATGT